MKSLPCFLKKELDWGGFTEQIEFHKKVLGMCRSLVGYQDDPNWECPYYMSVAEGMAKFGNLDINGNEWRRATKEEEDEDWNNGIYLRNPRRWRWSPGTCHICEQCATLAARYNAGVDGVSDCGYGECDTCSVHKSLEHVCKHARHVFQDRLDVEKGEELLTLVAPRHMYLVDLNK